MRFILTLFFQGYKTARLCCEIIRACLMSLNNVLGSNNEESKWGAFTFLKLPQILFALTGSNIVSSSKYGPYYYFYFFPP